MLTPAASGYQLSSVIASVGGIWSSASRVFQPVTGAGTEYGCTIGEAACLMRSAVGLYMSLTQKHTRDQDAGAIHHGRAVVVVEAGHCCRSGRLHTLQLFPGHRVFPAHRDVGAGKISERHRHDDTRASSANGGDGNLDLEMV